MDTMDDTAADTSQIDEDDVIGLKSVELSRTKSAPSRQTSRRHELISAELCRRVEQRDDQLIDVRRTSRDDLGRVLRSLYVFESRLRREQQHIRRQLGERDTVIRQQQVEIAKLRQTLAHYCHQHKAAADQARGDDHDVPAEMAAAASKPDLITSISPQSHREPTWPGDDVRTSASVGGGGAGGGGCSQDKRSSAPMILPLQSKPDGGGPRTATKNQPASALLQVVDAPPPRTKKNAVNGNGINFNKNVYSKTVTDLSLNDISSFPNPTPNNNLFVVSNSIFSKNEFAYNGVSKEAITSVKQNGKVITSALKKADKYPSAKTVHFGKTTHIPEPDDDGQTDIVKTVETLLLQCGDSTESENDTSSTASTETSPSVSQMVRKFESIGTAVVTGGSTDSKGGGGAAADFKGGGGSSPSNRQHHHNGSYIADAELKTAAELNTRPDPESADPPCPVELSDLDPRNNFEEFRFEDSDLDRDLDRPEADGLECPAGRPAPPSPLQSADDGRAGRVNYESFLEATGLSQKSIITVQSNRNLYGSHRNVQKPKDVKSRSRAKSASFVEYKPYSAPSTIKYWTEPYL